MVILITGGSGSGKSAFAENTVRRFKKPYFYLATMKPFGEETLRKIARHQRLRKDKGFETLECYEDVSKAEISSDGTVLLECMSNLTANVLFDRKETERERLDQLLPFDRQIIAQMDKLMKKTANLVIVTNEVFSDLPEQYERETRNYLSVLGKVNGALADRADEFYEVVYGIPIRLK